MALVAAPGPFGAALGAQRVLMRLEGSSPVFPGRVQRRQGVEGADKRPSGLGQCPG